MDGMGMRREVDPGDELRKWRVKRKLSLRAMGKVLHCDHSRVWKIENNRLPMTHEVAELCDTALNTGGALAAAVADAQQVIKPAQLPMAPALLVGRDDELAALTAGVRDRPHGTPSIVAIDGPAGVGKTALALRWTHNIASQYIDGHLYADLGAFVPYSSPVIVTVHNVLEEFLVALGVAAVPATTEQRARLFRSLTANRRLLVVLDNVSSLEEIAPLLPASPGCGVVVTSRRTLARLAGQLGATRVTVQPLTEPDAIDLVSRLVGSARAKVEIAAVTALTRLCGRLPLVLHAAAEKIAVYPHRRLDELIDELAEEVPRLSIGEAIDLASVLSASYHDVEPGAARVFRLLGLYSGEHLSMAAIAALAGVSVPLARRLLHPLATVHLVDIDSSDMVRMLAPVRAYARELVAAEDTDEDRRAAAQRLVVWYIHTAHAAHRAIAGHANTSSEPEGGAFPFVEGVFAQGFFDRAAATVWCEHQGANVSAVSTLAGEYGPSRAVHALGVAWAKVGTGLRSSAAFSDGGPSREPGADEGEHSNPNAAIEGANVPGRKHGDSSASHRHRDGGTNHGPPTESRVVPVTLAPGSDTHSRSGLLSPKGGRHKFRSPAGGGNLDDDDDSDTAGCCRIETSSSDWRGGDSSDRRTGLDRRQNDGDLVMCCQWGSEKFSAMAVRRRPVQDTVATDSGAADLRIPAPRS